MGDENEVQVFVYGTLRPRLQNGYPEDSRYYPLIEPHVRECRPATLENADLFDMGEFPAAIPGTTVIRGDLLTVNADALAIMDRIEGHPHFYRRQQVDVLLEAHAVEAWIYWAPDGFVFGRQHIANGDWLRRREGGALPTARLRDGEEPDATLLVALNRLLAQRLVWISTVRPDGRADCGAIRFAWLDGRIYLAPNSSSSISDNVATNPSVVLVHPDPVQDLALVGWATKVGRPKTDLVALFQHKYGPPSQGPWDEALLEVTPTRLRWGQPDIDREWSGSEVMSIRRAPTDGERMD